LWPNEFESSREYFSIHGTKLALAPSLPLDNARIGQDFPVMAEEGDADSGPSGDLSSAELLLRRQDLY
jgi:hypothetical protein